MLASVTVGLNVAQIIGRAANAETALADAAAEAGIEPAVSAMANSLAEAIEADRTAAPDVEARQTVIARIQAWPRPLPACHALSA